jgi:hypothetical protein
MRPINYFCMCLISFTGCVAVAIHSNALLVTSTGIFLTIGLDAVCRVLKGKEG